MKINNDTVESLKLDEFPVQKLLTEINGEQVVLFETAPSGDRDIFKWGTVDCEIAVTRTDYDSIQTLKPVSESYETWLDWDDEYPSISILLHNPAAKGYSHIHIPDWNGFEEEEYGYCPDRYTAVPAGSKIESVIASHWKGESTYRNDGFSITVDTDLEPGKDYLISFGVHIWDNTFQDLVVNFDLFSILIDDVLNSGEQAILE